MTAFTLVAALFDFFKACGVKAVANVGSMLLPFFDLGFGWIFPALIGLVVGLFLRGKSAKKAAA